MNSGTAATTSDSGKATDTLPATRSNTSAVCAASSAVAAVSPVSTKRRPCIRAASAFAGLWNTSLRGWSTMASASSLSASCARSGRMCPECVGSTVASTAIPTDRWRSIVFWSSTGTRGGSRIARPAAAARSGPSSGVATTTSTPRRTARSTAAASRESPASSPATTTTSSGPTHGGVAVATTMGRPACPAKAATSSDAAR